MFVNKLFPFEKFGYLPAFIAIEAKYQARCPTFGVVTVGDSLEMFVEKSVVDPFERRGTLRSVPWTSWSRRSCDRLSQLLNS